MGHEKNGSSPQNGPAEEQPVLIYEIRVKGCMDEAFWSDWFGSMEFKVDLEQEETTLAGPLIDQAELYGMLSRLRNKGLTLISVQQVRRDANPD